MIDFSQRITTERPVQRQNSSNLQKAFESDRGRVINSAGIRRLQQKTQVFPLERNAAVRSRLTHSLEVMQVGRFIVQSVFEKLGSRADGYGLKDKARAIESLVEIACLMHDIGNPPFGHFGEHAISEWAQQITPTLPGFTDSLNDDLTQQLLADLACFEGNAQAIRLVFSLLRLNLTYTQTACVLKYTRAAFEPKPEKGAPLEYLHKKPGFYFSEQDNIRKLTQALRMPANARHPLTYIMEAADDICYAIADMEDAVVKGLLSVEQLTDALKQAFKRRCRDLSPEDTMFKDNRKSFAAIIDGCFSAYEQEEVNRVGEFFIKLRVGITHLLVPHAAQQFVEHIEAIFEGTLNRAILDDGSKYEHVCAAFKDVAKAHVFSSDEVQTKELQGFRIISSLLESYSPLLNMSAEAFNQLFDGKGHQYPVELRLFNRIPKQYLSAYQVATKDDALNGYSVQQKRSLEQYYRCRLLIDVVSSMTDQLALDEYHVLFSH